VFAILYNYGRCKTYHPAAGYPHFLKKERPRQNREGAKKKMQQQRKRRIFASYKMHLMIYGGDNFFFLSVLSRSNFFCAITGVRFFRNLTYEEKYSSLEEKAIFYKS
jgi:hypothetical protein